MLKVTFHSTKYLQDEVSDQTTTTDNISSYSKRNTNSTKVGKSLCHLSSSSSRSGGVEGAEAPGAGVLEEGAEVPGAVVKGVGAGRMIDTSLGAYPFAFLKNFFISSWGQA
jgi:hypothetical protein